MSAPDVRTALAGMIEWLDSPPVRATFERMGSLTHSHPHLSVPIPPEFSAWAGHVIEQARAALATPDRRAQADGIRAECWYCMKPGYLYRHSGGYNIALCDTCRDASHEASR